MGHTWLPDAKLAASTVLTIILAVERTIRLLGRHHRRRRRGA